MSQVKIGWAMKEISLNENVLLFGQMYMRISQGILDPTYATALVLDSGDGHVIFCACDLEAHREDSIDRTIQKVIAQRPEINPDSIIMNVTHTHTGGAMVETPEISPDGVSIFSGLEYREFVVSRAAEAIVEAWDRRSEGGIAYGYGYAVVGHSRRVIYSEDMSVLHKNPISPNGHGIMYGNTKYPEFRHYEAGADHFLNLMFTFDKDQRMTGVLVNVPCPSQLSEHFLMQSSDYWCEVRRMVKEQFGEDVMVLPQCAAAGDLSPRILHYKEAQARRMKLKYDLQYDPSIAGGKMDAEQIKVRSERLDIAERILQGIQEVFSWAKKDILWEPEICCIRKVIPLTRRFVTEAEKVWCEETLEELRRSIPDPATVSPEEYRHAVSYYESIQDRNGKALARYNEQKTQHTLDCPIHVVKVGEVAFATNPYELYQDYMHRIQARSPFIQTFVVQLCSGPNASYVCTERANANKGYSASLFCNQVGCEGGQELVEATLDILSELAN